MKRTILALTAISLLLFFFGCGEKTTTSYYRHISFAGYNFQLKYPFQPDTSQSQYYFKVNRDADNRIIRVDFPKIGAIGLDPIGEYSAISLSYSNKLITLRYFDSHGWPARNGAKVFVESYHLDDNGLPISESNLDTLGNAMEDSNGVASFIYKANAAGFISEVMKLNLKGDTITSKDGNYRSRYTYDEIGNINENRSYGKDGDLINNSDSIAIIRMQYDKHSNPIEESFFNADNKPQESAKYGGARFTFEYDSIGQLVESKDYDRLGNLAECGKNSISISAYSYWPNGQQQEVRSYDSNNILRGSKKYNENGDIQEMRTYGPDGNLNLDPDDGYAVYLAKFDEWGNIIEQDFFDDKMHPVISPDYGYAAVKYEYENGSYVTKVSYFDCDGKLFENPKYQYAFSTTKLDRINYTKTETYRDVRGFPKKCKFGFAVKVNYFDKNMNLLNSKFFDENGNEVQGSIYDEKGYMVP